MNLPKMRSLGPGLLQEAQNALEYGEEMVARWLEQRMFARMKNKRRKAKSVAAYFNDARTHKSHGRRIDRDEARSQGIEIEDLEDDQRFQDAVLTAYHLTTILFEKSPATKLLLSHRGRTWVKNFVT